MELLPICEVLQCNVMSWLLSSYFLSVERKAINGTEKPLSGVFVHLRRLHVPSSCLFFFSFFFWGGGKQINDASVSTVSERNQDHHSFRQQNLERRCFQPELVLEIVLTPVEVKSAEVFTDPLPKTQPRTPVSSFAQPWHEMTLWIFAFNSG